MAWYIGLLATAVPSGCASPGLPLAEAAAAINPTFRVQPYRVRPGDLLEVVVPNAPDWNHEVLVQEDGSASFLFLDHLEVQGLSLEELDCRLTARYGELIKVPELSVLVKSRAPDTVFIIGEVTEPGEVPVGPGRLSLVQGLARVGGPLKETALLKQTLLVRWLPDEGVLRAWKVDARVEQWSAATPILLQAGDVVFVPNTPIDDVDIWVDQFIRRMIPIPVGIVIPY